MFNKLFLEKTEIKIETDDGVLNFIFPKDFGVTDSTVINGVEIKWTYNLIETFYIVNPIVSCPAGSNILI